MIASGRTLAALILLPTFASTAAAQTTLRYRVTGEWSGGFQAEIAIDNPGPDAIADWRLAFDLPAAIVDLWGATVVAHAGDRWQLAPAAWNAVVAAGSTAVVGFVAQRDGGAVAPSGCIFQGASCAFDLGAPAPTPSPAASGAATSTRTPAAGATPTSPASGGASPSRTRTRTATATPGGPYAGHGPSLDPIFNYGQALQRAWYFYEAQRSGPLPRFDGDLPFFDPASGARLHDGFLANRVPWRGDSDLIDGADVGLDLTGGWHDAGDHVKFGLPMAFSASFLAWGVLEFEETLRATGQLAHARDNLRWVADWFVRAHPEPNVLWGQVGQGDIDHRIWGPPEVMPHPRPAWRIDLAHPGPDLAAQTSSALAILSLVFRQDEPAYADVLLRHARELYDFAQATRAPETPTDKSLGRYSDSILDARSYYASTSGAQDDLPWAAAWLYRATGEARYLHDAEADYTRVADNTGHTAWTAVWDDVRYGLYFLMAQIAAEPGYAADTAVTAAQRQNGYFDYELHARNFLRHWLRPGGVARTPGGMAWLSGWASARYNTMTAFLALVHRRHLERTGGDAGLRQSYLDFATEQVNYVLGDNPLGMSYVVGFGETWSQVAHHRAAHGSSTNDVAEPALPRHVLYGGLAGGPRIDDSYTDDRNEYALTEVATDMNAGLNGALAGLVEAHGLAGNQPDPDFPPPAPAVDEIFAEARLVTQQPATLGTQVEVSVVNETAYPPRVTSALVFRYFLDLAELDGSGLSAADVVVDTYRNEGAGAAPLRRWGESGTLWYVEGSFAGTEIVPIGDQYKRRTMEFLVRLPWGASGWSAANDFSYLGLSTGAAQRAPRIAVYDTSRPAGAQLVWGQEPGPGGAVATATATRTASAAVPSATVTRTATAVATSATATRTVTGTPTNAPPSPATRTATRTATLAPPSTATRTATSAVAATATATGDAPATATRTAPAGIATMTRTPTRATTTTRTATRTRTPTRAATTTRTATGTRTSTRTRTATRTHTATRTRTPTRSATVARTATPTRTLGAAATATRTATIPAGSGLLASVVVESQWEGGYCAGIAVTNTSGEPLRTETLRFVLPADVAITQSWNGALSRSADRVAVQLPAWVGPIAPGETQKHFGYCAAGDTLPTHPAAP